MSKATGDYASLEEFRYLMMMKGYMNKKELQRFLDCGQRTATKVFNSIMADVEREGLENLSDNLILTKRAISYLGSSEKKITEAYERAIAQERS